jgi:hypothetical protein
VEKLFPPLVALRPTMYLSVIVYHKATKMSRRNLCIGKIAEGTLPSANLIAVVGSKPLWSVPSADSIAQTEPNVKNFSPPLAFSVNILYNIQVRYQFLWR